MKLHSTYDAARQLRKLYETRAQLVRVDRVIHPIADTDLEAKALDADHEVHCMDLAAQGIEFLNKVLHNLIGTEVWAGAMEIAYAPYEGGGYQRVAEYYRRAEAIQLMASRQRSLK